MIVQSLITKLLLLLWFSKKDKNKMNFSTTISVTKEEIIDVLLGKAQAAGAGKVKFLNFVYDDNQHIVGASMICDGFMSGSEKKNIDKKIRKIKQSDKPSDEK
jgi:hypothetical protein